MHKLLIGDTNYAHQFLWLLARKLFALSYGFASIKPYSADNQDHLIMTHEPVRGTLALFGLPDARSENLALHENAAQMTGKQYKNSQSLLRSGAEVITIGHAPSAPANATHSHIALPRPAAAKRSSPRLDLLVEDIFDSWERMMTMQVFLNAVAEGVSKFLPEPLRYDRSKTKDQIFTPTTASPVSAAALYKLRRAEPRAPRKFPRADLPFDVVMTELRSEKTEEPAAAKDVSREPTRKEPPAAPWPLPGSSRSVPARPAWRAVTWTGAIPHRSRTSHAAGESQVPEALPEPRAGN